MSKKKRRKSGSGPGPAGKRKSTAGIKHKAAPIDPIKQRLNEINRLKPIVEQAKKIAKRERVQEVMKEGRTNGILEMP